MKLEFTERLLFFCMLAQSVFTRLSLFALTPELGANATILCKMYAWSLLIVNLHNITLSLRTMTDDRA